MSCDEHVSHFGVGHECALVTCGICHEAFHVEGLAVGSGVVVFHVQAGEHGFVEVLLQKGRCVHLSQAK